MFVASGGCSSWDAEAWQTSIGSAAAPLSGTWLRRLYLAAPDKLIADASRFTGAAVSNGRRWYERGVPGKGPDPVLRDGDRSG